MYFPYLHGMQKEILALRQLAPILAQDAHVQPVIEPVRHVLASLRQTLQICETAGLPTWLVVNPVNQDFDDVAAPVSLDWGRHLLAAMGPRRAIRPTLLVHRRMTPELVRLFAQSFVAQPVGLVIVPGAMAMEALLDMLRGAQLERVFFKTEPPSATSLAMIGRERCLWVENRPVSMPIDLRRGSTAPHAGRQFFSDSLAHFLVEGGPGFSDHTSLPSRPGASGPSGADQFHLSHCQRVAPVGAISIDYFLADRTTDTRESPPAARDVADTERADPATDAIVGSDASAASADPDAPSAHAAEAAHPTAPAASEPRFFGALRKLCAAVADDTTVCFGPTLGLERFLACRTATAAPSPAMIRQWQLMHHLELVSGVLARRFPLDG